MKLRVKKGAVIKVELMGMSQPIYKIGKVDQVFDDELVLIEQGKQGASQNETVDVQKVHINKELIYSWEHANISLIKDVNPYRDSLLDDSGNNSKYTQYNSKGFCFGEGPDLE